MLFLRCNIYINLYLIIYLFFSSAPPIRVTHEITGNLFSCFNDFWLFSLVRTAFFEIYVSASPTTHVRATMGIPGGVRIDF